MFLGPRISVKVHVTGMEHACHFFRVGRHQISLDIGLVFDSSFRLAQIHVLHRPVHYPVILDDCPSKMYVYGLKWQFE